ncbi:C10 family peptidase [bacterium]|nr:C10 family peptidase [bacterium]
MKKYIIIITFLFIFLNISFAQQVDITEVHQVASSFLSYKNMNHSNALKKEVNRTIIAIDGIIDNKIDKLIAYVIHVDPKGFIITSTQKNIDPIISYSFNYNWNPDTSANNIFYNMLLSDMKNRRKSIQLLGNDLIRNISEQWEYGFNNDINQLGKYSYRQWPNEGTTFTGGWVETAWFQNAPFNNLCPIDPRTDPPIRSVVGCVGTAFAQIVNYHEKIGTLIFLDNDQYNTGLAILIDSDSTRLDFPSFRELNKKLSSVRNKYEQHLPLNNEDKAALCFACGILIKMDYSFCASGSLIERIPEVLINRMDFISGDFVHYDDELFDNLKDNIMNGLPVLLGVSGGVSFPHSVLADGYNTDGFYHINFGWGNTSPAPILDAWYLVPQYLPEGYHFIDEAIINIRPEADDENNLSLNTQTVILEPCVIGEISTIDSFKVINYNNIPLNINYIISSDSFSIGKAYNSFTDSLSSLQIAANNEAVFYVRFQPSEQRLYNGDIILKYANSKYLTLSLKGVGIPQNSTVIQSGSISGIWQKSNSPYIINGDIYINDGSNLLITPGTEVIFADYYMISVAENAQFVAKGTVNDTILFHSFDRQNGWKGVRFYTSGSDDTLQYCIFKNGLKSISSFADFDETRGGAVFCDKTSLLVKHCLFENNSADRGGAICAVYGFDNSRNENVTITIDSCLFRKNYAFGSGGSAVEAISNINIYNTSFIENVGEFSGALVIGGESNNSTIYNCYFNKNIAKGVGSAIKINYHNRLLCSNLLIHHESGHEADMGVCGVDNFYLYNSTLSDNKHTTALYVSECKNVQIMGNIFWNHYRPLYFSNNYYKPLVSYCALSDTSMIVGDYIGVSNIYENPLFENSDSYELNNMSPCIDKGVINNFFNDYNGSRNDIGCHGGRGIALPNLEINFEDVVLAESIIVDFEIFNFNNSILQITNSYFSTPEFSVKNSIFPMDIQRNEIDTLQLCFAPIETEIFNDTLTIISTFLPGGNGTVPVIGEGFSGISLQDEITGTIPKRSFSYTITNDLYVPENDSLIIEAGVIFDFNRNINFIVDGTLIINGTKEDPVIFTCPQSDEYWGKLEIGQSGHTYGSIYIESLHLSKCNEILIISQQRDDVLKNCIIENNYSPGSYNLNIIGSPLLEGCIIRDNYGFSTIHAVGRNWTISPYNFGIQFKNCIIVDNVTTFYGAIQAEKNVEIINCTISNNHSSRFNGLLAGGINFWSDDQWLIKASIKNSIIYNNTPFQVACIKDVENYGGFGDIIFSYNDIEGGENETKGGPDIIDWLEGNMDIDPEFSDTLYQLNDNSLCVDSGDPNNNLFNDPEDFSNPGYALYPAKGTVRNDMGAYGGNGEKDFIYSFTSFGYNWHLVNLPFLKESNYIYDLFRNPGQDLYAWDKMGNEYYKCYYIDSLSGYWMYTHHIYSWIIEGYPIYEYTSVCYAGWNLLGGVAKRTSSQNITTYPPNSLASVFGWDPEARRYFPAEELVPNHGYWFGVIRDCEVNVNAYETSMNNNSVITNTLPSMFISRFGGYPPPPPFEFNNNKVELPSNFKLFQNYPNPFNSRTIIKYHIPEESNITLIIYNTRGQRVKTLIDTNHLPGVHTIEWDCTNSNNEPVSTGIYFYKLCANNFGKTCKIIVIR